MMVQLAAEALGADAISLNRAPVLKLGRDMRGSP
jgi:hypothetical protein